MRDGTQEVAELVGDMLSQPKHESLLALERLEEKLPCTTKVKVGDVEMSGGVAAIAMLSAHHYGKSKRVYTRVAILHAQAIQEAYHGHEDELREDVLRMAEMISNEDASPREAWEQWNDLYQKLLTLIPALPLFSLLAGEEAVSKGKRGR